MNLGVSMAIGVLLSKPDLCICPSTSRICGRPIPSIRKSSPGTSLPDGRSISTSTFKFTLSLEPKQAVEMMRDISAIANTVGVGGYIVIGAQRGTVVGRVDTLSAVHLERTSEKLTQVSHNYLDPVPRFRLVPFQDPDPAIGEWGVIVIEPSTDQPYMFIRGFSDEKGKLVIRSGDWYVRRGDTTDLALPRDWARVLERRVRRACNPLSSRSAHSGKGSSPWSRTRRPVCAAS